MPEPAQNPIGPDGTLTLVQGDDYVSAVNKAITIADSAAAWPNLTHATVTLYVRRNRADRTPYLELTCAGTITGAGTGLQSVTFAPTADLTAQLNPNGLKGHKAAVKATFPASVQYPNGLTTTLWYGDATVYPSGTAPSATTPRG